MKIHNPADIWNMPPALQGIYSHAMETDVGTARQLHIAGQVGLRPDGSLPADFQGQCDQAMANAEAVLRSAGMSTADIVRLSYFVVRREDLPVLRECRLSRWAGVNPPATVLLVAGLVQPELLIEIEVLAQKALGEERCLP